MMIRPITTMDIKKNMLISMERFGTATENKRDVTWVF